MTTSSFMRFWYDDCGRHFHIVSLMEYSHLTCFAPVQSWLRSSMRVMHVENPGMLSIDGDLNLCHILGFVDVGSHSSGRSLAVLKIPGLTVLTSVNGQAADTS